MRVIAGTLKGRTLKAPKGDRTRPTADRVKEALFSIIGPITGGNVLDLYAGTGALGIEALSRGADFAVFVESAYDSMKCLQTNLADLRILERARIIHAPVERAHNEIARHAPFQLVFCDPPWRKLEAVWEMLARSELDSYLSSGGLLVLEHPANCAVNPQLWQEFELVLARAWGDSAVSILRRRSPPADR
jgi:16S rRNA (guanine966-N2)-methyltransferase